MPSVEDLVSSPLTELATVICSPSRIHAPPRPMTSRVWNGDQFSRSSRAGIRLRIGRGAVSVVLMEPPPTSPSVRPAQRQSAQLEPISGGYWRAHIIQRGESPPVPV